MDNLEPIDELRKSYRELASMAGELAHEIKNPLAVIIMNMEMLQEDFQEIDSPDARRALPRIETVNRQCARLQTMLNDFLRFTSLSDLELISGDLNAQIAYVLDFFDTQAKQQDIELIRHFDSDLPHILIDSQTLQSALINLVKNAIEAMPDGGQLLARTRITRTGLALDLIDTGCGMTTKTLINMFKDFYTSKDGGTGLGLPTAKKIIEAHGARMNVQSDVGLGTQFTIEFPTPPRVASE